MKENGKSISSVRCRRCARAELTLVTISNLMDRCVAERFMFSVSTIPTTTSAERACHAIYQPVGGWACVSSVVCSNIVDENLCKLKSHCW